MAGEELEKLPCVALIGVERVGREALAMFEIGQPQRAGTGELGGGGDEELVLAVQSERF
jgi:hypothetical protein